MPIQITIPDKEYFNEDTNEFVSVKGATLTLEHSLISLSKWEAKWKKPFMDPRVQKTLEESLDYIRCMTMAPQNVDPKVYLGIDAKLMAEINEYIADKQTATWFSSDTGESASSVRREKVTSELIYYWMINFQIPFECQKWHLNRLLTLIEVCKVKNTPPKKLGRAEQIRRDAALNAERKAKYHTKG